VTSKSVKSKLSADVARYLAGHPSHRDWVTGAVPLTRAVPIRSSTWRIWLQQGGDQARHKGFVGVLPPAIAHAAVSVLDGLHPANGLRAGADKRIDRADLHNLASAVAASRKSDADLVALWVGTMMWGSGMTNGRGPWRTAQGLGDERLTGVLRQTFGDVTNGHAETAYDGFELTGSGESFFTKWFWAASLAEPNASFRPLILDLRVRAALRLVGMHASGAWPPPYGASGYVRYLRLLHAVATAVHAEGFPGVCAERLEWLLYDRPPHKDQTEHCFVVWRATADR